jgi:hypothetical protein
MAPFSGLDLVFCPVQNGERKSYFEQECFLLRITPSPTNEVFGKVVSEIARGDWWR